MLDLQGLTIMVTRPSPQGQQLCADIEQHGGKALHIPTLAFAPPTDQVTYQAALAQLHKQDWLIFISPQAVFALQEPLQRLQANRPAHLQIAAVGGGTAAQLQAAGWQHILQPEGEWDSESLLKLSALQQVKHKKVAIIRGAGGREVMDKVLVERGAHLLTVIAYERVCPHIDLSAYRNLFIQGKVHSIIATSFTGIQHLKIMAGSLWPWIQPLPLLVPSLRMKALAQNLGFQTIWVADNPSSQAMLAALSKNEERL